VGARGSLAASPPPPALAAPPPPPRPAAAGDRAARQDCPITVSAPPLDPARQARVPSFSATQILDLEFRTEVRRPSATTLYLRVYTPRGHLYQTFTITLAPPVPGGPQPPAIARLPRAGEACPTDTAPGA